MFLVGWQPDCGWTDYFRGIFKKVGSGDIKTFSDKYVRSEEERRDIIKYYLATDGSFEQMLECVMLR